MKVGNDTDLYFEAHIAELYDRVVTESDDVELILRLLEPKKALHVIEPFCGTGRILIPLVCDGHTLTGLDRSAALLDRARAKINALDTAVRQRIALQQGGVSDALAHGL